MNPTRRSVSSLHHSFIPSLSFVCVDDFVNASFFLPITFIRYSYTSHMRFLVWTRLYYYTIIMATVFLSTLLPRSSQAWSCPSRQHLLHSSSLRRRRSISSLTAWASRQGQTATTTAADDESKDQRPNFTIYYNDVYEGTIDDRNERHTSLIECSLTF